MDPFGRPIVKSYSGQCCWNDPLVIGSDFRDVARRALLSAEGSRLRPMGYCERPTDMISSQTFMGKPHSRALHSRGFSRSTGPPAFEHWTKRCGGSLLRQPVEHVAKWHARGHGGVTNRCGEVNVAWCVETGGAEPVGVPGDQVASGVPLQPPECPSETTGVKRVPSRWCLLAVSWNVRLRRSYSARFW